MQSVELLTRGVTRAPFNIAGNPCLLATASNGDVVGWLAYQDHTSKRAAKVALWTMLDLADPLPVLKVVG